jgi:hypothetical protein
MKKLLTQTLTVIAGVSTLIFLVGCDRLFPPPERPVETPEQRLEQANQTFRSTVASALQEAAKLAEVTIKTDNFVAIPLDDGSSVVVNAVISVVENLTLEQLAKGADVLFVFLRLPQGSGLPSGFYIVRFFQTPDTTQWRAQFKNLEGQVALETDAEVGPGEVYRRGVPYILVDHAKITVNAQASVPLGTGGPDPTPLPAAGQKIAQATANFYQAARGIINTVKTNTYRQVIIGSRDDNLVVHTVFQGVEKLTLDELAKGQDVFFGYFRTPQSSELPTGFYTVRIAQSATGEWLARFVDAKGNTVKEGPATVGHGETPAQKTSGGWTIEIGPDGICIDYHIRPIVTKVCWPIPLTATIQAPEQQLEQANKAFRDAVASEMQEAARQAGVKIRTDNFVAIPFDDSSTVVVNAMIEGADRVSIEQLANGADVLFIYSGAKLGFAGREIEPGFYVVRISQNPASGQWLAQFKNSQGRIVLETEATVERPDSNAAKMQPMCTLGPKGELILFDEHDRFKNITLSVSSKRFPPRAGGAGGGGAGASISRTLREAAWQVVKEVAKEPVSIEQVVPVSLGPVPLPDAIAILFNCGTENKPDWCECTLVERGSDYAIWSCIGQKSKTSYVFVRSTSRWPEE